MVEPSNDEVPARFDPYAPSSTPAQMAASRHQIKLHFTENSAKVARGSGEAPSSGKRFRVDHPVTCTLLDESVVQVEEYLLNYSDRLVDAQCFARLTCRVRTNDDVVHVLLPRDATVKLPDREFLWKRCWAHVGYLFKLWDSLSDYDLPYFRSEEEINLMTLSEPNLASLLTNYNSPPIDVREVFPPLNDMTHYRTAHRWVRDDDFEHRFRCRHYDSGATDGAMDIHVGWHNIELLEMTYGHRKMWYPLVDQGCNHRIHVSRYLCAPTSFVLHYFGSRLCAVLEAGFHRRTYGDNDDAQDLATHNFLAVRISVYPWLVFTRRCHFVYHGVCIRGFETPGHRAKHGRLRFVLFRFPPAILDWIDNWGVRYLLHGSTISPHLVDTALLVVRLIDWGAAPGTCHILAPYFRYSTLTGEVDGVLNREAYLVGGLHHRPRHCVLT